VAHSINYGLVSLKRIKCGVIPAAGEGKRMGYLSSVLPKCLFPLYDKPVIHYVIENMVNAGIERIFIPVYSKKERIIEYFEKSVKEIDAEIVIIPLEELPNGLALSIYSAKDYVNDSFMTILGDDVTITDSLCPLIGLFSSSKAYALEGVVVENDEASIKRTCCLELNEKNQILQIIEKPESPISKIRGCGVYVFNRKIFDYIEKTPLSNRNEVEITSTIALVAKEGKAYAQFINGVNLNINTSDDLFKAWTLLKMRAIKNESY